MIEIVKISNGYVVRPSVFLGTANQSYPNTDKWIVVLDGDDKNKVATLIGEAVIKLATPSS
jgi:hypothetical protein